MDTIHSIERSLIFYLQNNKSFLLSYTNQSLGIGMHLVDTNRFVDVSFRKRIKYNRNDYDDDD